MSPILGIYASQISGHLFTFPASSYESIQTVNVGSGGASSVSFTSIPSTYTHLQIRAIARGSAATNEIWAQFNSDTAANYSTHQVYGSGAAAGASGTASTSYAKVGELSGTNASASIFGVSVIDILDYANTNKYKTTRALTGTDINGSGGYIVFASGNWRSTSAISSITLYYNTYSFNQYSSFALYGIKGVA